MDRNFKVALGTAICFIAVTIGSWFVPGTECLYGLCYDLPGLFSQDLLAVV